MAAKRPKRKKATKAIRESQGSKRSQAAKRGWQTRKAEHKKRSQAAKQGWQTRIARQTLARPAKEKTRVQKKIEKTAVKVEKRQSKREREQQAQIEQLKEELKRQKQKTRRIKRQRDKTRLETQKRRDENAKLRQQVETEQAMKRIVDRFEKIVMLDGLPPQRVNESRDMWAYRIVSTLVKQGVYSREEAYRAVAQHTGRNVSEIYSMFVYVGMGEMVA